MNLVSEYFKRDLTEAEEGQLAEWLESHPEDSARFAQEMKRLYQETGLPEPLWPQGSTPSGRLMSAFKWFLPLALLLLAFGVYRERSKIISLLQPSVVPVFETTPPSTVEKPIVEQDQVSMDNSSPDLNSEKTGIKTEENAKTIRPATVPVPVTAKPTVALPLLPLPPLVPPQTAQPVAPLAVLPAAQSAAALPGREYQRLSVVINLPQGGLATVRVVDSQNNEVEILYAGILPAGMQTFTWDGKTAQGIVAPPGHYFVEIKSGEDVMRQEIHLEKDPSSE